MDRRRNQEQVINGAMRVIFHFIWQRHMPLISPGEDPALRENPVY